MRLRRRLRVDPSIEAANTQVPITVACRLVGMDIAADVGYGRTRKLFCPFGVLYHADGGLEAAMRLYPDSNHAYCFACHSSFTPVWLAAQMWGLSPAAAAKVLLDRVGYRPSSLTTSQAFAQASGPGRKPDPTQLTEALKTFCRRCDPCWEHRQFDPGVAATLNRCLALCALVHTDEDARRWLETTKRAMAAHLTSLTGQL